MSQVIAIDGPAYVGKSVIAKALAERMGYLYINTGHMYRAVAKEALEKGTRLEDSGAVVSIVSSLNIQFKNEAHSCRTIVNQQDWTDKLDSYELVLSASKVASIPQVRSVLTDMQRRYATQQMIIMEGRDIGSVVFPDAAWKFFVTASLEVRARRMYKMIDLKEQTLYSNYKALIPKLVELDESDRNRKIAPLVMTEDAIIYDNSDSPSGSEDALILKYYITHSEEILGNSNLIKYRRQETSISRGNHS